ncbi:MAG: ribosome silencing factor [Syntrophaceae bacterium]|nr:ribosome silencing factor [Syntrophaceae bacterium]
MALHCVNACLTKKAQDLTILDVRSLSSFTDYFILCTGQSDRQVQAVCAAVQEYMKERGIRPLGIEGERHGRWVLMDYGDVVIHIFYETVRELYDLERLWSEAPQWKIPDDVTHMDVLEEVPGR